MPMTPPPQRGLAPSRLDRAETLHPIIKPRATATPPFPFVATSPPFASLAPSLTAARTKSLAKIARSSSPSPSARAPHRYAVLRISSGKKPGRPFGLSFGPFCRASGFPPANSTLWASVPSGALLRLGQSLLQLASCTRPGLRAPLPRHARGGSPGHPRPLAKVLAHCPKPLPRNRARPPMARCASSPSPHTATLLASQLWPSGHKDHQGYRSHPEATFRLSGSQPVGTPEPPRGYPEATRAWVLAGAVLAFERMLDSRDPL